MRAVTIYFAVLGAMAVIALWVIACGVLWLALATKPPEPPLPKGQEMPPGRARRTGTHG
jgi:hypothetical protein